MAFNIAYATAGGSPWSFPTMPVPLHDEGLVLLDGEKIPHKGTLVDNIRLSGDFNGQYEGFLGTTLVWTVDDTDINASVEGFIGHTQCCWYDSVNDRLYVFAVDTTTAPDTYYTAFITLETGAVTNVGNTQVTTDPANIFNLFIMTVSRTAIDSGNFTLTFADRTIVLNESTGAEVSNVASVNVSPPNTTIGTYATLDGTTHTSLIRQAFSGTADLILTRNQKTILIPMPDSMFNVTGGAAVLVISWGDKVKLHADAASEVMLRTFLRVDFDAWLSKVADHGGLP